MKKTTVLMFILLVILLLLWRFSQFHTVGRDDRLASRDFLSFFEQQAAEDPWDAISAEQLKADASQRDRIESLFARLETFYDEFPRDSETSVVQACRVLLDFQEKVLSGDGYGNFLLADAIGRIVFVELTKHLVLSKKQSLARGPDLNALLEQFTVFKPSFEQFNRAAQREFGVSWEITEIERRKDAPWAMLQRMEKVKGWHPGELTLEDKNLRRLLREPHWGMLALRVTRNEDSVTTTLPLLRLFLDSVEQIPTDKLELYEAEKRTKAKALDELRENPSGWTRPRLTRSFGIEGLLTLIEDGRIDWVVPRFDSVRVMVDKQKAREKREVQ